MENFTISEIEGFKIVRDDLYEGGTKKRAFEKLIHTIKEKEFVYACDYYGYAGYAIALTALKDGRKVKLFYPSPKKNTKIFEKATNLPNVSFEIVPNTKTQIKASKEAIRYAKENNARFFTIGMDFPEFVNELTKVVKELEINGPEIWCMGGSGALARSLKKAYPEIPVKVVSVGTANANFEGIDEVYEAPESLNEEARIKPPYPSAPNYDAKVWQFIKSHAKKGSYVWNVAP